VDGLLIQALRSARRIRQFPRRNLLPLPRWNLALLPRRRLAPFPPWLVRQLRRLQAQVTETCRRQLRRALLVGALLVGLAIVGRAIAARAIVATIV